MDNKWTWDDFCDFDDKDAFKIHNADCDNYEARIAELEAELDELTTEIVSAHFANATIDRLREVVPNDKIISTSKAYRALIKAIDILYPQPKASIREIAERHGFAPMPPELAQASVDWETIFVAFPQPKETTDE